MKRALLLFSKRSIERHEADAEGLVTVLAAAAQTDRLDIQFEYAFYDDLLHIISTERAAIVDTKSGNDIADYDVVYQRRWGGFPEHALACAIYLDKKSVPCFDSEANMAGSKNKLTQYWRFWEAGLPFPATVFGAGEHSRSAALDRIETLPFSFPMILKGVDASRGQDNYLVQSLEELRSIYTQHPDTAFLMQEFLPNEGDYRVIVAGNEARFAMYRTAIEGKHTNNTSQGGKATLVAVSDLPKQIIDDCIMAAQVFNREFAGVDVVIRKDTGAHYFFEVNRSPQIESGKHIAEKASVLAKYMYEKANNEES